MKKRTEQTAVSMRVPYMRPEAELVVTATECMQNPGGMISESEYDGDGAAKPVTLYEEEERDEETPVVTYRYSPWDD